MLGTVTTLLFAGYCVANTVTSLLVGGLEHQPSPTRLGWVQPTVYGPGQAHPRMDGLNPAQFFFYLFLLIKLVFLFFCFFVILQVSRVFFINIKQQFFMLEKNINSVLKYPVFVPWYCSPVLFIRYCSPRPFKKKIKKIFVSFIIFPRSFYVILINIGQYFYVVKYKSGIEIPGFRLSRIQKQNKKKYFFVHTAKCLKTKNSYCIFLYTKKKNVLACILALITSLLKSREYWPKFQKHNKILFCLSINIPGMTLYVIYIPDILLLIFLIFFFLH